jgi:hypothetical protein
MLDWLNGTLPAEGEIPAGLLALRLGTAVVLGAGVAGVYYLTQRKGRAEAAPLVATLVLLTALLAMVTLVIGGNVARAFGLVGALSIVRFRTVVDDTRDTAFVIFAVVTGMAVGAGQIGLALVGLPVVGLAAWVLSGWAREVEGAAGPATLVVRLGIGLDPEAVLGGVLFRHLQEFRLVAAGTVRQGAALELTYRATLLPGSSAVGLVGELNRVEGVQGVEWKESGGV